MATTITFRRGTAAPTSASGITLGEPAFDSSLNRLYVGLGSGVTAAWVGAGICGSSGGIAAGITYQVPTMGAVKDYVASTTSGVATLNSLTGAVTLTGGSNIGVTSASGSITITNQGVQSFNGLTGAVYGVTTSTANTFTAAQTFNSGLTASTIDSTGAARFATTVTATGAVTANGGLTASTIDSTGAARFATTITATGAVTANGGLTASVLDVTNAARLTGGLTASTTDHTGAARFATTVTVTGAVAANGGLTASTIDSTGAARFATTVTATGAVAANGGLTASTLDVSGAARTTGDMTVGATLTVNGNFFVSGTVTTVNRSDLNIDDKTITMGRTLASDTLADGGGLSLSGTAARTWTWSNTRSAWESNQGVNVATGYGYAVNGTSVLTSTTLGSSVVTSSLTTVGTIGTGVWQGTVVGVTYGGTGLASYTIGDVLYASGTGTLAKLSSTTSGYLFASTGAGAAPEYKQLLVKDANANSIATSASTTGALTLTIQDATASLKGVAKFDTTNFTVSSGNVTITGVDGGTY